MNFREVAKTIEAAQKPEMLRIRELPVSIDAREFEGPLFHQSLTRAYSITRKVRELLEAGTPPAVVLECMDIMEGHDE